MVNHPMAQETMLLRIDLRNVLHMIHHEMEAGRGDDSIQILKRSHQRGIADCGGPAGGPSYRVVEPGRLSVGEVIFGRFRCRCLAAYRPDSSDQKAGQGAATL